MKQIERADELLRRYQKHHVLVLSVLLIMALIGVVWVIDHQERQLAARYNAINQATESIPAPTSQGVTAGAQTDNTAEDQPAPDNLVAKSSPPPAPASPMAPRRTTSSNRTTPSSAPQNSQPSNNTPPPNNPPPDDPKEPEPPQPLICILGLCLL